MWSNPLDYLEIGFYWNTLQLRSFPFPIPKVNYLQMTLIFSGKNQSHQDIFTTLFYWAFFSLFDGDTIGGENLSVKKVGRKEKHHSTESNEIHEFMVRKNVESGTRFPSELRNEV